MKVPLATEVATTGQPGENYAKKVQDAIDLAVRNHTARKLKYDGVNANAADARVVRLFKKLPHSKLIPLSNPRHRDQTKTAGIVGGRLILETVGIAGPNRALYTD